MSILRKMWNKLLGIGYDPGPPAISYRNYRIQRNPYMWLNDQFIWSHRDYSGPGDRRCGTAASIEEAKELIDELEESHGAE